MNKLLLRIVTLLLVPALIADPATSVMRETTCATRPILCAARYEFSSQALALPIGSPEIIHSEVDELRREGELPAPNPPAVAASRESQNKKMLSQRKKVYISSAVLFLSTLGLSLYSGEGALLLGVVGLCVLILGRLKIYIDELTFKPAAFVVKQPRASAPPVPPIVRGAIHRVLIVEDDEDQRSFLTQGLQAAGYAVLTAENGVYALKQLEVGRVDLVIADLRMPIMDGEELINRLREKYPRLPVILCSSHREDYLDEIAKELGVFALAKTGDRAHFLSRIKQLLNPPAAAAEPKPQGPIAHWKFDDERAAPHDPRRGPRFERDYQNELNAREQFRRLTGQNAEGPIAYVDSKNKPPASAPSEKASVDAKIQSILAQSRKSEEPMSLISRVLSVFASTKALSLWMLGLYGVVVSMFFVVHYNSAIQEGAATFIVAHPSMMVLLPIFGFFILFIFLFPSNAFYGAARRVPRILKDVDPEKEVLELLRSKTKLTANDLQALYLKVRATPENVIRAREALRRAPLDQAVVDALFAIAVEKETDPQKLWSHVHLLPYITAPSGPLVFLALLRDHLFHLPLKDHARERYAGRNGFVDADLAVALFPHVVRYFMDHLQDRPTNDPERLQFLWMIYAIRQPSLYDVGWWRRWHIGQWLDFFKDVRYIKRLDHILYSFPLVRVLRIQQEQKNIEWMDFQLPPLDWRIASITSLFDSLVASQPAENSPATAISPKKSELGRWRISLKSGYFLGIAAFAALSGFAGSDFFSTPVGITIGLAICGVGWFFFWLIRPLFNVHMTQITPDSLVIGVVDRHDYLWRFIKAEGEFSKRIGFSLFRAGLIGKRMMRVPFVDALNNALDQLQGTKYQTAMRFWSYQGAANTPPMDYIRGFVTRRAPVAILEVHDWQFHVPGFLIFPEEAVQVISGVARFLLSVYEDPLLRNNISIQGKLDGDIARMVRNVDILSFVLTGIASRADSIFFVLKDRISFLLESGQSIGFRLLESVNSDPETRHLITPREQTRLMELTQQASQASLSPEHMLELIRARIPQKESHPDSDLRSQRAA